MPTVPGDAAQDWVARLLLTSPDLGVLVGEGNEIEEASPPARELLGLGEGELEPVDWVGMTPPEFRLGDDAAIREALTSGTSPWFSKTFIRRDGGRVDAHLMVVTLSQEPFRWLALIRPSGERVASPAADAAMSASGLLMMARRLAGAASVDDVLEIFDRLAAPTLGASYVNVALLDEEGETLTIHHDPGLVAEVGERWTHMAVSPSTMLGDAVGRNTLVVCDDLQDLRERYPGSGDEAERLGFATLAAAPLESDHGAVIGALGVAWRRRSSVDLEQVRVVADLMANALELARLVDRQRTIERTFQSMLLPPPVALGSRLDLAVRHRGVDAAPGGDFYDVIDAGEVVWVVVGDVAGHGLGAARTMGKVRFFVRALCRDAEPGDLLDDVSELLVRESQGEIATCVVLKWREGSGHLELASAGHPAPIAVCDGRAHLMTVVPGPPLGVGRGDEGTPVVRMPRPDRFVAYTDGLIERRGESIDAAFDRLLDTVATHGGSDVDALADVLLDTLPDGDRDDDIVVVCADFPRAR